MYLGLDLGSYHSKMAVFEGPNLRDAYEAGEYSIPTAFYYDAEVGKQIGEDALYAGRGVHAKNLITGIKKGNDCKKRYCFDGITFDSAEIVRDIYTSLIQKGNESLKNANGIVLTTPVGYSDPQKKQLLKAINAYYGDPLPVSAIIEEPVAAVIAYHGFALNDRYYLVYDLGGDSCNVALVKTDMILSERYTVVAHDKCRIGGNAWDAELEKYIVQKLEEDIGIEICTNHVKDQVKRAAHEVKHELSLLDKSESVARVEINGKLFSYVISKEEFIQMTQHLLDITMDCLQGLCDDYSSVNIDEIICVGGGANMPQVENGLMRRFPDYQIRIWKPEYTIANGAALLSCKLNGKSILRDSFTQYPFLGMRKKSLRARFSAIITTLLLFIEKGCGWFHGLKNKQMKQKAYLRKKYNRTARKFRHIMLGWKNAIRHFIRFI